MIERNEGHYTHKGYDVIYDDEGGWLVCAPNEKKVLLCARSLKVARAWINYRILDDEIDTLEAQLDDRIFRLLTSIVDEISTLGTHNEYIC